MEQEEALQKDFMTEWFYNYKCGAYHTSFE